MAASLWRWQRLIPTRWVEEWQERLRFVGAERVVVVEFPAPKKTARLEVYVERSSEARTLIKNFGGRVVKVAPQSWVGAGLTKPLVLISRDVAVARTALALKTWRQGHPDGLGLHLPAGLAFGTGEHGTTAMLLRRLGRGSGEGLTDFLDLGTGSGILALAARQRGVPSVVAMDFDPVAIKTARQNEKLNFRRSAIEWLEGDVLVWSPRRRFALITANLYSSLLVQAAPRMWSWLKPGGEMWLSGVLRTQADEVQRAFRGLRGKILETKQAGKWVMLVVQKGARS